MAMTNAQRQRKRRQKIATENKLKGKRMKVVYVRPEHWDKVDRYVAKLG